MEKDLQIIITQIKPLFPEIITTEPCNPDDYPIPEFPTPIECGPNEVMVSNCSEVYGGCYDTCNGEVCTEICQPLCEGNFFSLVIATFDVFSTITNWVTKWIYWIYCFKG